jgi:hypothetical protein
LSCSTTTLMKRLVRIGPIVVHGLGQGAIVPPGYNEAIADRFFGACP